MLTHFYDLTTPRPAHTRCGLPRYSTRWTVTVRLVTCSRCKILLEQDQHRAASCSEKKERPVSD